MADNGCRLEGEERLQRSLDTAILERRRNRGRATPDANWSGSVTGTATAPSCSDPRHRLRTLCRMTVRPIVICGEPVLHRPTRPVTAFDPPDDPTADLAVLVADLFETNEAANGAGLAANQIGDDRRVYIYDCPDKGTRRRGYVVNPTIQTSTIPENMPDPDDDSEGCLSVPGENFPTGRADWAKVTGFDVTGKPVEVEGTGFFARCLQHEVDHLDGYLYLDRLIGRNARAARKAVKANGWGVPGLSWMPGKDPDPFGH